MSGEYRLGLLKMRVGRHSCRAKFFGASDQGLGKPSERVKDGVNARAGVETKIRRDLLVATSSGVKLVGRITNGGSKPHLDEMMNILGICLVHHGGIVR